VNGLFAAGTYTINPSVAPSATNFQSFTSAINALNCGASGHVIFNVATDQVFTEDVPALNVNGTPTATVTFQKSGVGANPKVIPLSAGTIASSTTLGAHGDGIIVINGGDYITFDGIDLETNPSFSAAGMYEYGYY